MKLQILLRSFVPRKCTEFLPMLTKSLILKSYIRNWYLKNNGESHGIRYAVLYFSSMFKGKTKQNTDMSLRRNK